MPTLLSRVLAALTAVCCVAAVGVYLWIAVSHLTYGGEVETVEGAMVDQARWVAEGRQLYRPPSVEFTPLLYTPLYTWLAVPVAAVTGTGLFPLRLISLVSSLALLAGVGWLVRKHTGSVLGALVAVGILAASYAVTGAWYATARVDSLAWALAIGALVVARSGASTRRAALAGVLVVLAFLTKQTAAAVAVPLAVWLLSRSVQRAAVFSVVAAGGAAVSVLLLNATSDGWFWYYIGHMPGQHALVDEVYVGFWTDDLRPLWPALVVTVVVAVRGLLRPVAAADRWLWPGLFVVLVLSAWSSRLHSGGFLNVLIPAVIALALASGLAVGRLVAAARPVQEGGKPVPPAVAGGTDERATVHLARGTRPSGRARWAAALALVASLGQLAALSYEPSRYVPDEGQEEAWQDLRATIARLPGPVWVPTHGGLTADRGQPPDAHLFGLYDVVRAKDRRYADQVRADVAAAVRSRRWGAIVIDRPRSFPLSDQPLLPPDFDQHYVASETLPYSASLRPLTGFRTAPAVVYVRRPA